ncbi:MAG: diaminopimelate decarboxylase [Acidimicrobiales bacterium]
MARPISLHLLPDSTSINDGRASVGGLELVDLAEEFGTPLFVYDEDHLRSRCREAVAAFPGGVSYATKAFLCTAMARLVHEEGMSLDVASAGELFVARSAGVPGDSCILHGNNKSMSELRYGIEEGVRHVMVDSFDELDRLDQLHRETGQVVDIMLRITPGVEAHTHEFVSTGQDDSKFGFTVSSGLAHRAVERAEASAAVTLIGIHAHIGSQVFRIDSFAKTVQVLADFTNPLDLEELSVGGGLGVAYVQDEEAPSLSDWGRAVHQACSSAGVTARITAEPGRSIVGAAAITLYTVGTIKPLAGIRTYLAVDGGMSDNPRPVLYGSGYETFLPRAVDADRPLEVRVVGKHCESGDVLVRDGWIPADTVVGDVLATPVTGAYGYGMASNYQKLARPAVVFVGDGNARVVVRRETLEDILRLDVQ